MNDVIDSKDMSQGNLTYLTLDRFGNENSALALNGGFTVVPAGIYFDTQEFTISVWIYPQQVDNWARVIDFGNDRQSNNILISLSYETPLLNDSISPKLAIYSGKSVIVEALSAQTIETNRWHFIAVNFDGTNARIYINGQLSVHIHQNYTLNISNRTNCYIGKSNLHWDGYSYSYLDDLRFYNKSLTQQEILELMNRNDTSKRIKFIFLQSNSRILLKLYKKKLSLINL